MNWKEYFAELGMREGIQALFAWLHTVPADKASKWDAPLTALRDALNERYPTPNEPYLPKV